MKDGIRRRIALKSGVDDLPGALDRLSTADLQSLLLEVMAQRAGALEGLKPAQTFHPLVTCRQAA